MALLPIAEKEKKYVGVFKKLDDLIQKALEKNLDEKGEFASMYEGVSMLLSEIEDVENTLKVIKKLYAESWEGVKNEDVNTQLPIVARIYLKGLFLAMQAVKVTAKAEQYSKYLQANNPQISMVGQIPIVGEGEGEPVGKEN